MRITITRIGGTLILAGLLQVVPAGMVRGQAVGFAPGIGVAPDGVALNVAPVATADRRYVRMGVSPLSIGFEGFQVVTVPAAVAGGGGFGPGMGLGLGGPGWGAGELPSGYAMTQGSPFAARSRPTPLLGKVNRTTPQVDPAPRSNPGRAIGATRSAIGSRRRR